MVDKNGKEGTKHTESAYAIRAKNWLVWAAADARSQN